MYPIAVYTEVSALKSAVYELKRWLYLILSPANYPQSQIRVDSDI